MLECPCVKEHVSREVTGRWPLATGRWPLTAGRWPLAAGRWPLAVGGCRHGSSSRVFHVICQSANCTCKKWTCRVDRRDTIQCHVYCFSCYVTSNGYPQSHKSSRRATAAVTAAAAAAAGTAASASAAATMASVATDSQSHLCGSHLMWTPDRRRVVCAIVYI